MRQQIINQAQKYLTVRDRFLDKKIVDLMALTSNHELDEIILFLKNMYREKRENLQKLVISDTTTGELDQTVACLFRIHMSLKIIINAMEEEIHESEQRTGTGG
ncbi:hypothetical protein ACFL43_02555 [Thermodesulfobacteriota bacterium]